MKKMMLVMTAFLAFAGCRLFQSVGTGAPVENVQVTVATGYSLEKALHSAADRRQWSPQKLKEGVYRLTINQRNNHCCVEVHLNGNESFSILPVSSNIPVRKYDQWVNNLQREICHRARNGK